MPNPTPRERAHPAAPTANDVAARAGVSQPTVSLVLSRNPKARLSASTRERVFRAAAELRYRPNVVARGLVRRRSFALAVLVPDVSNPFFAAVLSGAERVASEAGYAIFLCEARNRPPEYYLQNLRARQIDGVIMEAAGAAAVPAESLVGINVALVDEPSERLPGVASDALGAGAAAADHLLALGHRRLGFMGPAADVHAFRMRERGFVGRLRAAGITMDSNLLRRAPPTVAGGHDAMRALLALDTRPSAVFCANDLMALGAYQASARARIAIPSELSIVGCDDIEMAQVVTPPLTTVTVPARELGARAARLLVRQIEGAQPKQQTKPLPVRLVVRGSTAAPAEDRAR